MTATRTPQDNQVADQASSFAVITAAGSGGLASGQSSAPPPASTSRGLNSLVGVGYAAAGFATFALLWHLVHLRTGELPGPADTFGALQELLRAPFAKDGDAGQGIGLQLYDSLVRVAKGFFFATLVGIPLGFLIGTNRVAWRMFNPIMQVLRPVSPLAWFPVMLTLFTKADPAAVGVIFITSLWPVVINTAAGAASVPHDQHDVARVFKFSRLTELREIVVPHTIPSIITGLRLSMGIAWMVIVAAEMVSAASGIGFYVWQSYNGAGLRYVLAAIVLIGVIGVAIDQLFVSLGRKLAPEVSA